MKLWLTGIAIPATALALAFATPAVAQDDDNAMQAQPGMGDLVIDPAKPFGDIDISMFGEDDATRSAWVEGLSEEQRNELKDRCIKILGDPQIAVDDASKTFCQDLDTYYQEDF